MADLGVWNPQGEKLRQALLAKNPIPAIRGLSDTSWTLLNLPELDECKGVKQNPRYHALDVYEHTLRVIHEAGEDPLLRLVALFHDLGKPLTRTPNGSFKGHEAVSEEIARKVLPKLGCPEEISQRVYVLVALHMRPLSHENDPMGSKAAGRLAAQAGAEWANLIAFSRADVTGAGMQRDLAWLDDLYALGLNAAQIKPVTKNPLEIDGAKVMEILGLKPGKEVGMVLKEMTGLVNDGKLGRGEQAQIDWLEQKRGRELA